MSHSPADSLAWRKSTYSGPENNCVEVAGLPGGAKAIRDSKDPARGYLRVTASQWTALLDMVE
ncbi:DUF397 domain-containing protein [Sphaerisporangium rhizosphaerae]|uniref:DUF397 domain-containing protein n=1 Tax=Sphaerisporangium rhizosphaerae TaxID=2269375 RepID=A0ABW2NYH2_9ACTN